MKYFMLFLCGVLLLGGCFGKKTDSATSNANGASQQVEFDTNDYLDQALLDLEAVKE
jgi:hypothetical protein